MLRAVANWEVSSGHEPPAVTAADIAAMSEALVPATPQQIAEEVGKAMALYPPPPNPTMHFAACDALLRDVPLDILRAGILRVIATATFTPRPAEIWAQVEMALGERKRLVDKARVAASMAERRRVSEPKRPATDEERQRVAALVSGLTVRPQVNPLLEAGPDRPETDDVNALRRVAAQAGVFRLPDIDHPEVQRWLRSA